MSRGVNKVILVGHLGKDPELRYSPNGSAVANVSIATSEQWKDKSTGEKQEKTEWHRLVFFGKVAEIAGEYLRKGSQVYVEGRIQTRKWQDKEGRDQYTTEIVVNDLQMIGGRGQSDTSAHDTNSTPADRRPQQTPEKSGGADFDDDIPF